MQGNFVLSKRPASDEIPDGSDSVESGSSQLQGCLEGIEESPSIREAPEASYPAVEPSLSAPSLEQSGASVIPCIATVIQMRQSLSSLRSSSDNLF